MYNKINPFEGCLGAYRIKKDFVKKSIKFKFFLQKAVIN